MCWMLMLAPVMTFTLGDCSTTTATAEISCMVWQPVSWSKKDTPQTIEEVKAHNARRKAYCEVK
jgi:hypothetical protein